MSITFYLDIIVQRVIIDKEGGENVIAIIVIYQPFYIQTRHGY